MKSKKKRDPVEGESTRVTAIAYDFVTPEEAAEILRVGRSAMYLALQRGEIPGVVRVGRLFRIRRSALLPSKP